MSREKKPRKRSSMTAGRSFAVVSGPGRSCGSAGGRARIALDGSGGEAPAVYPGRSAAPGTAEAPSSGGRRGDPDQLVAVVVRPRHDRPGLPRPRAARPVLPNARPVAGRPTPSRPAGLPASGAPVRTSRSRISIRPVSGTCFVTAFVAGSMPHSSSARAPQRIPSAKTRGIPPPVSISAVTAGFAPSSRRMPVVSLDAQNALPPAIPSRCSFGWTSIAVRPTTRAAGSTTTISPPVPSAQSRPSAARSMPASGPVATPRVAPVVGSTTTRWSPAPPVSNRATRTSVGPPTTTCEPPVPTGMARFVPVARSTRIRSPLSGRDHPKAVRRRSRSRSARHRRQDGSRRGPADDSAVVAAAGVVGAGRDELAGPAARVGADPDGRLLAAPQAPARTRTNAIRPDRAPRARWAFRTTRDTR